MAAPVVEVSMFLGASNNASWNTGGVSYPNSFLPVRILPVGGYSSAIWNPLTSAVEAYQPGVNSDGSGAGRWGFEARFLERCKDINPEVSQYVLKHWQSGTAGCTLAHRTDYPTWSNRAAPPEPPSGQPISTTDQAFLNAMKKWDAMCLCMYPPGTPVYSRRLHVKRIVVTMGEIESTRQADAEAFARDLPEFLDAVRFYTQSPDAHGIIVQTPTALGGAYVGLVRAAQQATAAMRRNALVDMDGQPVSGTPLHYHPDAVVAGGDLVFEAAMSIMD